MPEITLIPKKEKSEFKFSFQKSIFYFPITLLTIVVLVFGGFFLYNFTLNKSINAVEQEIQLIESQRDIKKDSEFINKIFNLGNRIDNLKGILETQIHSSSFFSFLEKLTLPKTRYFGLSLDLGNDSAFLKGETEGYVALVKQMIVFSRSPEIKAAKFSGIGLSPSGKVGFSLELSFDKKILMEQEPLKK